MEENNQNWYVVHTYSGYEERVKKNLEQRIKYMDSEDEITSVVIPTEDEIEVKSGQKRTVSKKVLPGYVLIKMAMNDKSWKIVRNTPGITGFVGGGDEPTPLSEEESTRILRQKEAEAPKLKIGFQEGESVRVTDGPFLDFIGVVESINSEKGKVKVLLTLFGRSTPVELDFLQVEKL